MHGHDGLSLGLFFAATFAAASFFSLIASWTSCRWTGTSFRASIPKRTLSLRMSTIVTTMLSPMTIFSPIFLLSTSIAFFLKAREPSILTCNTCCNYVLRRVWQEREVFSPLCQTQRPIKERFMRSNYTDLWLHSNKKEPERL